MKFILNCLLVNPMGINGIALSTSLVTLFNATMLTILLRKKISIGYHNLIKSCVKIFLVGLITYVAGYTLSSLYSSHFEWNFMTGLIKLILVTSVMTIVYFALSYIFKIEYMEELIEKIKNKLGKKNAL